MNIYLESNFVLELALLQEQSASCEQILSLGEAGRVRLAVPAYSLAEPYETLVRRQRKRKKMKEALDGELKQLSRSAAYEDQLGRFRDLTDLLINSADEEDRRLEEVRSRLIETADLIPLEASVLAAAARYQRKHDFSPQDALVYSAVLAHLEQDYARPSCFLNKDKDFDDQDVREELGGYNCKLFPRFDSGRQYILDRLG